MNVNAADGWGGSEKRYLLGAFPYQRTFDGTGNMVMCFLVGCEEISTAVTSVRPKSARN